VSDSRDHRPDRLQIVYGVLCTREGLPVAVEVFDGDTADPSTLAVQIAKLSLVAASGGRPRKAANLLTWRS
jgi:transposase